MRQSGGSKAVSSGKNQRGFEVWKPGYVFYIILHLYAQCMACFHTLIIHLLNSLNSCICCWRRAVRAGCNLKCPHIYRSRWRNPYSIPWCLCLIFLQQYLEKGNSRNSIPLRCRLQDFNQSTFDLERRGTGRVAGTNSRTYAFHEIDQEKSANSRLHSMQFQKVLSTSLTFKNASTSLDIARTLEGKPISQSAQKEIFWFDDSVGLEHVDKLLDCSKQTCKTPISIFKIRQCSAVLEKLFRFLSPNILPWSGRSVIVKCIEMLYRHLIWECKFRFKPWQTGYIRHCPWIPTFFLPIQQLISYVQSIHSSLLALSGIVNHFLHSSWTTKFDQANLHL